MWLALLLLTWGCGGVVCVWFCYLSWTLTEIHYDHSSILGLGNIVVQVWNGLVTSLYHTYAPHGHPSLLTQDGLARILIAVYVAVHVVFLVRGVIGPIWERHKLGVRSMPSGREVQRFEQVFAALGRTQAATPDAPPLKRPYNWRVRDDDQGMQMRWIGLTLVIDRGVLVSRHFPPLLAHQLAHVHSFDLLPRSLYRILPPLRLVLLTLLRLALACGPIV